MVCGVASYPLTVDIANSADFPCNTVYAYNADVGITITLTAIGNDGTFPAWIPYGGRYAVTLDSQCNCSVTGGSTSGVADGPIPLIFVSCNDEVQ
jgi:hypothetical protein